MGSAEDRIDEAVLPLARRIVAQEARLFRLAGAWAERCARVAQVVAQARWLLAEQENNHRRDMRELLDMHNALRAQQGLGPLIRVGIVRDGVYEHAWGSVTHSDGKSVLRTLRPDGMWGHGAAAPTLPESAPPCTPQGTTPGAGKE